MLAPLIRLSTAACQRPGTRSRFNPPHMKKRIEPRTTSIHNAELVKWNGVPSSADPVSESIWNWCIGSILTSAAALIAYPVLPFVRNPPIRRAPLKSV